MTTDVVEDAEYWHQKFLAANTAAGNLLVMWLDLVDGARKSEQVSDTESAVCDCFQCHMLQELWKEYGPRLKAAILPI